MSVDHEFQVLVVGGGVAGLAAAGTLSAAGLDPVVVDRDDERFPVEGPVELWDDALEMLARMDLEDAVRRAGIRVERRSLRTADGTVERTLDPGRHPDCVAIEYGRLRSTLAAALPDGTVQSDTTVEAVKESAAGATVTFEHGVSEPFDAVVGADGVRSTVRRTLGGAEASACGTVTATFPLSRATDVEGAVEQWAADGAVLQVLPTGDGPWAVLTVPSGTPRVAERLAGVDWLPESAEAATEADLDRSVDRRVDHGAAVGARVALVGDAAGARHPLAGDGPATALADAVALADALVGDGPLERRLAGYARRRRSSTGGPPDGEGTGVPLASLDDDAPDALQSAVRWRGRQLTARATASRFDGAGHDG